MNSPKILPSEMMLLCGRCYIDQKFFDKWYIVSGVPFGIVRQFDGSYDVVFQGSDDSLAWFRDFILRTINDPVIGIINEGQSSGMDDVIETIIAAIPDKNTIIRFSGHSKGADMAILVAAKMYKQFCYENIAVYAFEPTKTAYNGNTILPEIYKIIPLLITHNEWAGRQDIVPNEFPEYYHPVPITKISCPGVTLDPKLGMTLHHWQIIYVAIVLWERKNG
jgi:Lipase (class 3)